VFLPLVNRLIGYLAGGGASTADAAVGEEMVLLRGGWDLDQPVYVVRPDGGRQRATVVMAGTEPVALLPGDAVDQPGFYRVEAPNRAPSGSEGSASLLRAVNAPRTESVPRVLDLDRAQVQAGQWRLTTLVPDAGHDAESVAALWATGRGGRGLWDTLLWVALMAALLEPLVAGRVARGRAKDVASAPRGRRKVRERIPAGVGARKDSRTNRASEERAA
jgi:hypothetical protein